MCTRRHFVRGVAISLCFGLVHSGLLPAPVCLGCATLFRTQSCTARPNLVCQMIAFKLLFDIGGIPLCDQKPCNGYGQTTRNTCTGIFNCPAERIEINGVCDGLDICCRPASGGGGGTGGGGESAESSDNSLQIANDLAPSDSDMAPAGYNIAAASNDMASTDNDMAPTDNDMAPTDNDLTPNDNGLRPIDDDLIPMQ